MEYYTQQSPSKKRKESQINIQIVTASAGLLGSILLGANTGIILGLYCLIRNILKKQVELKERDIKLLLYSQIIIVLLLNNQGILGVCPLIASTSYTYTMLKSENKESMSKAIILNAMLWLPYKVYIKNYIGGVFMLVTVVTVLISLRKGAEK